MKQSSTSFDVGCVLHLTAMSLKAMRIERLREFAKLRKLEGPVELGKAIGKPVNQASDLLSGRAAFGEKIARAIEEFAGLPAGWLDVPAGATALWPFSEELLESVRELDRAANQQLENVMRAHLNLPPVASPPQLRQVGRPDALNHPAPPTIQERRPGYAERPRRPTRRSS